MDLTEIVISGTYGFTTIVLTVFSIISTYIKSNVFPVEIVKMNRYSLVLIFLPIMIHTIYLWLAIDYPIVLEGVISLSESTFLIIYIFIHSYCILEIYYNPTNFKKKIIKKRTHSFMEKIKNISSEEEILKQLKIEKEEFDKYLKDNRRNNENNIINKEDANNYFIELTKKILNKFMDTDNILKCLEILKDYLEINEKSIDNYPITDITKIEYLLIYGLKDNNSLEVYQSIFNRLYSLYENNKKVETTDEVYALECYSELFRQLQLLTWCDSKKIKYLLDTLFDNKWNTKDSVYLSYFYKIIINNYKYNKIDLDPETKNKIEYIMNTYKDETSIKDNQYGVDFTELLKIIMKYLKKGE